MGLAEGEGIGSDFSRGLGRVQLAAITGHEVCGSSECAVCRPAQAGDRPAFWQATDRERITVENAYESLLIANLIGVAIRPEAALYSRRPLDPGAQ